MFVPDRLATRRRALGLSRAEFGRLVLNGKTARAIADYETGRAIPCPSALRWISRLLDCPMAALFDAEDDPQLMAAVALEREIARDVESAPDIPDAVIERLRLLLPVRATPLPKNRAIAS